MTIALAWSLIHTVCSYRSITYLITGFRGAGEERTASTDVIEGKYPLPVLYFSSCFISLHRTKKGGYISLRSKYIEL